MKNMTQEKRKKREERKRKVKVKTAVSLSKFCFLRMPELRKLDQNEAAKCTTCKWLHGKF